jgi:hypothetical protein
MPNPLTKSVARIGVLKKIPVARMLVLAELLVLLREHMSKLEPHERRRLLELVRRGRGRPSSLSARERRELSALLAKAEPRAFVNLAAQKVTGIPVPGGKRGRGS